MSNHEPTMADLVKALPKDGTPMRIVSPYGTYDASYQGTFKYVDEDTKGWTKAPAKVCPECGEETHVRRTEGEERADVCDECGWDNA